MTQTELETMESNYITLINNLLTNPKPNYKVGEHSYSWGDYLRILQTGLEKVQAQLAAIPAEEITLARDYYPPSIP